MEACLHFRAAEWCHEMELSHSTKNHHAFCVSFKVDAVGRKGGMDVGL